MQSFLCFFFGPCGVIRGFGVVSVSVFDEDCTWVVGLGMRKSLMLVWISDFSLTVFFWSFLL